MITECQVEKKQTNRYRKIERIDQAKAMEEFFIKGKTQEEVAEQFAVPRSTLQSWLKRKHTLAGKLDPEVVAFYESSAGIAHLHCLLTALFFRIPKNGRMRSFVYPKLSTAN
jgi:hypothetical protein